ncbi:hypothetical protein Glove_501g5 [Diversispora epigaea]|uniref:Uncharacterized protein n=1 Tax=Diversispora epigaea TaxID=1348612 RepID=A0A397GH54_9GLOM|nr:hypothetical protein Glove_501g5 [Diversispora epigaea]
MTRLCPECNQEYNNYWCKLCGSTRFKNDFDKWTSGNVTIGKFMILINQLEKFENESEKLVVLEIK